MTQNMIGLIWRKLSQIWRSEFTRTVFVTIAAHTTSISVGLTQGYSAVLLPQLASYSSSLSITKEESSWIAGLGVISTPVGALLSGILVEVIGRKSTVIVTNLPFLLGWITIGLATDVRLLYLGRIVSGLAAGMTTASYLYVAEISSKELRSTLSAFGPIFVSLGVLIVYTLGFLTSWQKVALFSTVFSLLSIIAMSNVPESPAWYVSRNQIPNASRSLNWLRQNPKNAEAELSALTKRNPNADETKEHDSKADDKTISKKTVSKLKDYISAISSPTVYKPFIILLFFFIFQEGSGIYIFLFYAIQIFKEFGTDYDENLISVSLGILRFVMSILGAFLMSRIGRRPLGIFSGACMSASMLTVCTYQLVSYFIPQTYHFVPLLCILFHVGFSMLGFLQLPWILTSELFPISHRGLLSGVVSSLAYCFIFISVKVYPDLLQILELHGLLWVFFLMSSLGTLFLYLYLPETKDKSLEEISQSFEDEDCHPRKASVLSNVQTDSGHLAFLTERHFRGSHFIKRELSDFEIVFGLTKNEDKNR